MLTKDTQYLVNLCQYYLSGKISVENFSKEFEMFYIDDARDFPDIEHYILDDMFDAIDNYEPIKEERDAEPTYIDENELKIRVQEALNKLRI